MKEIKTATITFHKAINYGAILQTYALQQSIFSLNINNKIINYDCKYISDEYKLINTASIKRFIKSIILIKDFYYKRKNFERFIKKHIVLTNPVDKSILRGEIFNDEYNFFITGSDQVWNYEITNFDDAYFLNFVKDKRKIKSYAASFGINYIPENLKLRYKKYLEAFSTILVREKTGSEIVENLINTKVNIVLDPVFLVNKNKWNEIASKTKFDNIKNKYILIYMSTPAIKLFAEKLAAKYKLPIIYISDLVLKKKNRIGKIEARLGPEEFVSAIKNAKFVLTASFHATAFSIIFNKEFFININSEGKARGSRLIDVLNLLEINNREISSGKIIEEFDSLNWESINKKLEIEKNRSIQELKRMLSIE